MRIKASILGVSFAALFAVASQPAGFLLLFGVPVFVFAILSLNEWSDFPLRRRVLIVPIALFCHAAGLAVLFAPWLGGHLMWRTLFSGATTGLLFIAGHRAVFGFPRSPFAYLQVLLVAVAAVLLLQVAGEFQQQRPWLIGVETRGGQVMGFYILAWYVGLAFLLHNAQRRDGRLAA